MKICVHCGAHIKQVLIQGLDWVWVDETGFVNCDFDRPHRPTRDAYVSVGPISTVAGGAPTTGQVAEAVLSPDSLPDLVALPDRRREALQGIAESVQEIMADPCVPQQLTSLCESVESLAYIVATLLPATSGGDRS